VRSLFCFRDLFLGVRLCSTGKTTYHLKGASQVKIQFIDDKRQYTAGLAVSMAGERLPGQIIFAGQTDACHPKVCCYFESCSHIQVEQKDWVYCHSPTHWQDVPTTKRWLELIAFPYFREARTKLNLPINSTGLIIWDVWYTHTDESIIELCRKNHVRVNIVTAGYTGELSILDTDCNLPFKVLLD
jgi:hypothetical protein